MITLGSMKDHRRGLSAGFGHLLARWLLGMSFLSVPSAGAHPISMSSATADVRTNRVVVEMRILVEDLVLYQDLKPDADHLYTRALLEAAAEKHVNFLKAYFTLRDYEGHLLEGRRTGMDTSAIPDAGVNAIDLMAFSVNYIFEFDTGRAPEYLTFAQEFGGQDAVLPSIMDLAVFQQGIWTEEVVKIGPGQPHVAHFDWSKPPQPMPRSWRERKRLREEKQREMLGITSYSAVYSYIYITDREVRHEILVPLLTLETWLPVGRRDPDFLDVDEQEALRVKILDYFFRKHPVEIDGIPVKPLLERGDFYGLDFRDFAQFSEPRRVSVHNARAGLILTYPTKGAPRKVRLTWEEFNQFTPFLKSLVYVHQDKAFQHFLVPSEPTLEWTGEEYSALPALDEVPLPPDFKLLAIPVLSVALALAAAAVLLTWLLVGRRSWRPLRVVVLLMALAILSVLARPYFHQMVEDPFARADPVTPEAARAVFSALHQNIYRAFDYPAEEDVYDALAHSVSGGLLEQLYLQLQKSLKMQEQGGAVARIEQVEMISGELQSPDPSQALPLDRYFDYHSVWTVSGSVEHWGHIHTRKNQYEADFTVNATPSGWRITRFEVAVEKRLKFETGLRDIN